MSKGPPHRMKVMEVSGYEMYGLLGGDSEMSIGKETLKSNPLKRIFPCSGDRKRKKKTLKHRNPPLLLLCAVQIH